jgi:hypothetical protein
MTSQRFRTRDVALWHGYNAVITMHDVLQSYVRCSVTFVSIGIEPH